MEHLQQQYRRYVIAKLDLKHSLRCVRELMARAPLPPVETSHLVYALNLAAIVSYSRAFTSNKPGTTRPASSCLPSSVLRIYDQTEREIHADVLTRRDREFAHSDAEALDVHFSLDAEGGETVSVRRTQQVFNVPTLRRFEAMIVRMLATVDDRRKDTGLKLGPGTYG